MKVYIVVQKDVCHCGSEIIRVYKTKAKANKKCDKLNRKVKQNKNAFDRILDVIFMVKEYEVE